MSDYIQRRDAAQATVDEYLGKPFEWGKVDCARMAAFTLRQLKRPAPLSKFGTYSNALQAARALKAQGFANLGELIDSLGYPRIAPAMALPADLVALEADELDVMVCVALGRGRVLGFHEEAEGVIVMQPLSYVAAWRSI